MIMKKRYIKPQMNVHTLKRMQMLVGSVKGVYGKIDGQEDPTGGLKYAGYVEEDQEEEIDPD